MTYIGERQGGGFHYKTTVEIDKENSTIHMTHYELTMGKEIDIILNGESAIQSGNYWLVKMTDMEIIKNNGIVEKMKINGEQGHNKIKEYFDFYFLSEDAANPAIDKNSEMSIATVFPNTNNIFDLAIHKASTHYNGDNINIEDKLDGLKLKKQ